MRTNPFLRYVRPLREETYRNVNDIEQFSLIVYN